MSAFPPAVVIPRTPPLLPYGSDATGDPGDHRGGDPLRCRVRNATAEEGSRIDGHTVCPRREPPGRSQRSDQSGSAQWSGHWSRLVLARYPDDDIDLFTH